MRESQFNLAIKCGGLNEISMWQAVGSKKFKIQWKKIFQKFCNGILKFENLEMKFSMYCFSQNATMIQKFYFIFC